MPENRHHTDADLLSAMKVFDDRKAFEALFNKYWESAKQIAQKKLHDQDAVHEIVQDFFINLWEKRKSLEIQNFGAYLTAALRNRCLNYISAQLVKQKYWNYYKAFIPVVAEVTEMDVRYDNLQEALEEGIRSLPEKSGKVFRLNRLEGKTISEIAKRLNLSEKAIEFHLSRSVKELRLILKDFILTWAVLISISVNL